MKSTDMVLWWQRTRAATCFCGKQEHVHGVGTAHAEPLLRAQPCFSARWFPLQQHPKVRHTGDREWKILCNVNARSKKCLKKKGQT